MEGLINDGWKSEGEDYIIETLRLRDRICQSNATFIIHFARLYLVYYRYQLTDIVTLRDTRCGKS